MVLANQKTCPPSLFEFITLITYLFSLLLCACLASCLPLCLPVLAYRSPHFYLTQCVGLSTYVILSFLNLFSFLFTLPPIVFIFVLPHSFFFSPPPTTPCRSLFTFSTLELFLTCFSQLPFSTCLFSVLPLLFCGRTGELD